jgi:hypothetical protein
MDAEKISKNLAIGLLAAGKIKPALGAALVSRLLRERDKTMENANLEESESFKMLRLLREWDSK